MILMENRKPEENLDEENRYLKAQKRVKEIKSFYTHLITYVAVNVVIIIFKCSDRVPLFFWIASSHSFRLSTLRSLSE